MKLRKRFLAVLMSILLLLPVVSNQGTLVVKAAAPDAFANAEGISKDTKTISLTENATNYVEELKVADAEYLTRTGYLYKLEAGTYTMDLQFGDNAMGYGIVLYDAEGRGLTELGMDNQKYRVLVNEGTYAPAYMMIVSYGKVTGTVSVTRTEGIADIIDTKLANVEEITETPKSCTVDDLQDMAVPNYKGLNIDGNYNYVFAGYRLIKAKLYKIKVAAGAECYLEFESTCTNHSGMDVRNSYSFYEEVKENGKTTIQEPSGVYGSSVACGGKAEQKLNNYSNMDKTYYVACMPNCSNCSFSVAKKKIKALDTTVSAQEITGTCTLNNQKTSSELYAAAANWMESRSITGYGSLYKLSVPANTEVYVQVEEEVAITQENAITKAIWYNENQITTNCIVEGMYPGHRYTSRTTSDTDQNYYLWLCSNTPEQSFGLKVTYQKSITSHYPDAIQLKDGEITINNVSGMTNDIPGFITDAGTHNINIYEHALLYSIDEKAYDIKFTFGQQISQMASINIMDEDGIIINAPYIPQEGLTTSQEIIHSKPEGKQWFLITGNENDLSGLKIEVNKAECLTENEVNKLALETPYTCLTSDETVRIKGKEYYAYGVFTDSDVRVDVTCNTDPTAYADRIYVTDLYGNLEYGYDHTVMNSVLYMNQEEIGNTYRVLLEQSATGNQQKKLLLIEKDISGFDISNITLLATEKQTLSECQPELLEDGKTVSYSYEEDLDIELNPAYHYVSTDANDKTLSYEREGKLFQVTVPAEYSAAVVLKTYDTIYKNIAVYEDLDAHPIQIEKSESSDPIKITLPKEKQDKTYYLYAYGDPLYGGIFWGGGMDIVFNIDPKPTPQPQPAVTPAVTATYRTHVQSFGWQNAVQNGVVSGTSGKAKRLEAIEISLAGNPNLGIQYTTHCQSYGWLPWSSNGEMNGTEGEAKRLEAIKIQLTGADKDKYDVYYRVHAQTYGWLGWAKNGSPAGTAGLAKRLEAIQIVVVKKGESIDAKLAGITSARNETYISNSTSTPSIPGDTTPNVAYKTHVQTFGWQGWCYNGAMAGTTGKAKRLEGINIKLSNKPYSGGIAYTTHVQTFGWQGDVNNPATWKRDGEMAGTSGKAKRLEAICIKLTGEMEKHYDVYYRVHAQTFGWLAWTKNGAQAGTAGLAKRLEGIQIVLVPKGGAAPSTNYGGIRSVSSLPYISR